MVSARGEPFGWFQPGKKLLDGFSLGRTFWVVSARGEPFGRFQPRKKLLDGFSLGRTFWMVSARGEPFGWFQPGKKLLGGFSPGRTFWVVSARGEPFGWFWAGENLLGQLPSQLLDPSNRGKKGAGVTGVSMLGVHVHLKQTIPHRPTKTSFIHTLSRGPVSSPLILPDL